jgi:hypothetical protein
VKFLDHETHYKDLFVLNQPVLINRRWFRNELVNYFNYTKNISLRRGFWGEEKDRLAKMIGGNPFLAGIITFLNIPNFRKTGRPLAER